MRTQPGTVEVICPRCFPAGAPSGKKKTPADLVVALRLNEALFECRRCRWKNRIEVARQTAPRRAAPSTP